MSFAVVVFLDQETDRRIRSVWQELAEQDIAGYMHASGNRPHLKLAIFEKLNLGEAERRLSALAAGTPPLEIGFKHFGLFTEPKPSIFLGPAVAPALLELKRRTDEALDGLGNRPGYDFFQPGHWVPHCLLALEMERERLAEGLETVMRLPVPLSGSIKELGVIEFFPVRHLFTFTLGE